MSNPIELIPGAQPKSDLNKPKKQKKTVKRRSNTEALRRILVPIDNGIKPRHIQLDFNNWRERQNDPRYYAAVGKALREWVDNDPYARDFVQFSTSLGVSEPQLRDWASKYPQFKIDYEYARSVLRWNRDLSGSMGELHIGIVNTTRHLYDPKYNDEEDRKAVLITKAKAEAAQPAKVEVNIRELSSDMEVELVGGENLH